MAVQSMGIPIIQEFAPGEIIGSKGHVTAMKFNGRDNESELTMKADQVVFAIGRNLLVTLQRYQSWRKSIYWWRYGKWWKDCCTGCC